MKRSILLISLTIVFTARSMGYTPDYNRKTEKTSTNKSFQYQNLLSSTVSNNNVRFDVKLKITSYTLDTSTDKKILSGKADISYYDLFGAGNSKTVKDGRKYYKINREEVSRTC